MVSMFRLENLQRMLYEDPYDTDIGDSIEKERPLLLVKTSALTTPGTPCSTEGRYGFEYFCRCGHHFECGHHWFRILSWVETTENIVVSGNHWVWIPLYLLINTETVVYIWHDTIEDVCIMIVETTNGGDHTAYFVLWRREHGFNHDCGDHWRWRPQSTIENVIRIWVWTESQIVSSRVWRYQNLNSRCGYHWRWIPQRFDSLLQIFRPQYFDSLLQIFRIWEWKSLKFWMWNPQTFSLQTFSRWEWRPQKSKWRSQNLQIIMADYKYIMWRSLFWVGDHYAMNIRVITEFSKPSWCVYMWREMWGTDQFGHWRQPCVRPIILKQGWADELRHVDFWADHPKSSSGTVISSRD